MFNTDRNVGNSAQPVSATLRPRLARIAGVGLGVTFALAGSLWFTPAASAHGGDELQPISEESTTTDAGSSLLGPALLVGSAAAGGAAFYLVLKNRKQ